LLRLALRIHCETIFPYLALIDQKVDSSMTRHGRKLATSLRALRRARQLVVIDTKILGGSPVFRGTRVRVHLIAELVAQGIAFAELRPAIRASQAR
jgi:hypothetical protein